MKTNDFINALVADQASQRPPITRTLMIALGIGVALTLAIFATYVGARDNVLYSATHSLWFVMKFVFTLALALPAFFIVRRSVRPDGGDATVWTWLLPAAGVIAAWLLVEFMTLDRAAWTATAFDANLAVCLTIIPLLSAAPLVAVLYVLRDGAPSRPALAGAFGGLLSGAIGATLYASHCSADSPLFVGLWYPIAIGAIMLVGAILGARVARW